MASLPPPPVRLEATFDASREKGKKRQKRRVTLPEDASAAAADAASAKDSAAAGAQADDDGKSSVGSSFHTQLGDSDVGGDDLPTGEGTSEDAAPPRTVARQGERFRDTLPPVSVSVPATFKIGNPAVPPAQRRENEGNMNCAFINWGELPSQSQNPAQRRRMELQLRHCPCFLLCVAECSADMEGILRRPVATAQVDASAAAGASTSGIPSASAAAGAKGETPLLEGRPEFEFVTCRGKERSSLCVAARKHVCAGMDLLFWERLVDGTYKSKKNVEKVAYTRILIVDLRFDSSYAHFGSSVTVCVVHLHRDTAKQNKNGKGFRAALDKWWPYLRARLLEHDVSRRYSFTAVIQGGPKLDVGRPPRSKRLGRGTARMTGRRLRPDPCPSTPPKVEVANQAHPNQGPDPRPWTEARHPQMAIGNPLQDYIGVWISDI